MPEIKPDLSEWSRCISVHWSLPVQCVLPCTHRENWHEAWHPSTGNRIRYRRSMGIFHTEELNDGWRDLEIPPPGATCGEPHTSKPGVFCQDLRGHGWTHHATVDGCRHTWHPARREPTPDQVAEDLRRAREIASGAEAKLQAIKQLRAWKNEDGNWFVFADDIHAVLHADDSATASTGEAVAS